MERLPVLQRGQLVTQEMAPDGDHTEPILGSQCLNEAGDVRRTSRRRDAFYDFNLVVRG